MGNSLRQKSRSKFWVSSSRSGCRGLDIIAAYKDGSARYYDFSGAGIVWEHPDASLDPSTNPLIEVGDQVVNHIGVWNQPRPPAPARDYARISFLTPSGLHFGEGPFE